MDLDLSGLDLDTKEGRREAKCRLAQKGQSLRHQRISSGESTTNLRW